VFTNFRFSVNRLKNQIIVDEFRGCVQQKAFGDMAFSEWSVQIILHTEYLL